MRRVGPDRSLNEYRVRYFDLLGAVQATQVISRVAGEALKAFPSRLPRQSRKKVLALMTELAQALTSAVQKVDTRRPHPSIAPAADWVRIRDRGTLARSTVQLFMAQSMSGRPLGDIDFPYRLRAQELAMLLAHFDAFMGDTVRAICAREPNTLKRSKTLSWEEILGCGSWEVLIGHLVEERAYSFGWNSARGKVNSLERDFGLTIGSDQKDLATLDHVEHIRHLIVHNNGRISREYIRRTGRSNVRVGKQVPVPRRLVDEAATAITLVCSDTFRAVAVQFFAADTEALTGVWRRHRPEKESGRV